MEDMIDVAHPTIILYAEKKVREKLMTLKSLDNSGQHQHRAINLDLLNPLTTYGI